MMQHHLHTAFDRARQGTYGDLQFFLDGLQDKTLLEADVAIRHQPQLSSQFDAAELFVDKKEHEEVAFGASEPEVLAPLCLIVGFHHRGLINAAALFSSLPKSPGVLCQLAILPKAWVSSDVDSILALNACDLLVATQALQDAGLPMGCYLAEVATRLGEVHLVDEAIVQGLCLTERAQAHWQSVSLAKTASKTAPSSGLLGVNSLAQGVGPQSAFLQASKVGFLTASAVQVLLDQGLDLAELPYPLPDIDDAEYYFQLAMHQRAHTSGEHLAWIAQTYVNALTCFMVQGKEARAVYLLAEAASAAIDLSDVVNDWSAFKPSLLALLSAEQRDAKITNDLGL